MRNVAIIIFASLALSGCAGELVGKVPVIDGDTFATVHIARPSGMIGCGVRTTIQLDHTNFYELACGDHIVFRVPLVEEMTMSQTTSMVADHIVLEPKKGKEYYFVNDCVPFGACWFGRQDRVQFLKYSDRCRKQITLGF